jgi:hypothetical protein
MEDVSRDVGRGRKSSKDIICTECSKIDFEKVVSLGSKNRDNPRGVCIQKVGKRFREGLASHCVLCQILLNAVFFDDEDSKPWKENGEDELRAFHFLSSSSLIDATSLHFNDYRQAHALQCLAIIPSGYVPFAWIGWSARLKRHLQDRGCSVVYRDGDPNQEIFAVRNVSAHFEPSLVASWLQYCSENHKMLCSKGRSLVTGLRLIDCESFTVKTADLEDTYVALSYVWGSSVQENVPRGVGNTIDNNQLPQSLPTVITDAVKVTKDLGFRYLWIDKFCIDQDDPGTKHDQIKQMGLVYENAELTIIAAAGLDENYGLPGVGDTLRKAQLSVEIGKFRILSSMQHPHRAIHSSTWSTRGWTFQEAMLSRRRLVFTEEQVYFECNAMNCYESVSIPFNFCMTRTGLSNVTVSEQVHSVGMLNMHSALPISILYQCLVSLIVI